jgi:ribosome-binding factor A
MTQRTDRIDELLRQEISDLLTREVADPRIGFATVTDVETAPDLSHARVWVSVIGQPEDRAVTVRALERAMPFIRHELGKRLRLRRIPEFSVRLDESIERGSRVMQLINELEAGATPDELPEGESLPTPTLRMHHEGDAIDVPDFGPTGATQKPRLQRRGAPPKASGRPAGTKGGARPAGAKGASRPSATDNAGRPAGAKGAARPRPDADRRRTGR